MRKGGAAPRSVAAFPSCARECAAPAARGPASGPRRSRVEHARGAAPFTSRGLAAGTTLALRSATMKTRRRVGGGAPVVVCLLLSAATAHAEALTTAEQTEQIDIVNARVANWRSNHPSLVGTPMMVIVTRKNGGDTRFYA